MKRIMLLNPATSSLLAILFLIQTGISAQTKESIAINVKSYPVEKLTGRTQHNQVGKLSSALNEIVQPVMLYDIIFLKKRLHFLHYNLSLFCA